MAMNISTALFEDILRRLDYMDRQGHLKNLYSDQRCGHCPPRDDTALWELSVKLIQLQQRTVEIYSSTISNITAQEMSDLNEWVAAGRSVYDNPYLLHDESGNIMDFISACRIDSEITDNPELFFGDNPFTDYDFNEDELPF